MNRKSLLLLLFFCVFFFSCRWNKVSVKVKNCSNSDFKSLMVRFGDSLQIFKDLHQGDRTKRFWSNRTYGKGYTKVILPSEDTLIHFPLNQHGQKIYYWGKILVKISIEQSKETHKDTLVIKTRKRFLF